MHTKGTVNLCGLSGYHLSCVSQYTKIHVQHCYSQLSFGADQLNTTVHGTMKTTPYELVFGQPPRQGIFHGIKGPSVMEEDVEDIMEDEQVNFFQDQCSMLGFD